MVDDKINSNGDLVGPIFQFLLQVRMMLTKRDFQHCYCFWDGYNSGFNRYEIYSDYKKNRDKQYSEYNREINNYVAKILSHQPKSEKQIQKEKEAEVFNNIKLKLQLILEELYIRQVTDDSGSGVEGDDLISYYVNNKKPNEKIYIISRDNDLTQLIDDDVCIYQPTEKLFLHKGNFKEIKGFPVENLVLKKILIGDSSDNIKGIKGLGEGVLLKHFDKINKEVVTLDYIIERAKEINEERKANKKKPLVVCENIINRVTDGCQGEDIYEINEKIINLRKPILTKEVIEEMESIMYAPLDPSERSMENLYEIILELQIVDLMDNKFSTFFSPFLILVNNEKKFFKNTK
ncbi:MAG: hypothetical protein M0R03_15200 [Novosphingobium sp.]|nr:hypothetical protein [Novosphingobium sp.]